jgi:hypothetical protein
MSRPQRPTPNRQLLQDTNANASSPTGWQWARIPFTRASSSLSLSPLAKGAQTPSANTPGEDKEDPFATPAPSQAPSSVPSQKNTPQASRVQTPEVSKDSTVQQSSVSTVPIHFSSERLTQLSRNRVTLLPSHGRHRPSPSLVPLRFVPGLHQTHRGLREAYPRTRR